MAEYFPPTEDLPTFDVVVFRDANDIVPYATSSGTSNQVAVQSDDSATTYFPLFSLAGTTPTGIARTLYNDPSVTPLSYVPSTSTLTATTFSGALSGTATNADNVNLTVDNTATTYYPVFAASGAGYQSLLYDTTTTPLSYQPSTSTLVASLFSGNLNISDSNSSGTVYPTFVTGTGSRSLQIDSGLTPLSYVPSTSTLTASTFSGALSGTATNATNVNLTVNDSATTYYPVFAASGAGNQSLLYDTTVTPLSYVPITSTLTASTFVGALSGTANLATQVTLSSTATGSLYYLVMSDTQSGTSSLLTDNAGASYDSTTNTAVINITGASNQVRVQSDDSATTYYPLFSLAGTTPTGTQRTLYNDPSTTALSYVPSTSTLTASVFNGTAITAANVTVSTVSLAPNDWYPTMVDSTGTTKSLRIDDTGVDTFTYNITTNRLTVSNLTTRVRQIVIGAGVFGHGNVTTDYTNLVCGFNSSQIAFNANGQNTIYGTNCGTLMNVASKNNTMIGFQSGNLLSSGNNNTLVGSGAGDSINSGSNNTFVGVLAGDLNTGAGQNTAVGVQALNSNISGTNNTALGYQAGNTTTGSNNIIIGSGAVVPTAANSNQIVIGTINETMYIQGGFRFYMPTSQLATTTNLPRGGEVLPFFYAVNVTLAGQTFTLPDPINYNGHMITFKRKANNTQYKMAHLGGGTKFTPIGSITNVATITVTTAIFQQTMISDGSSWCVISQA